MPPDNLSLLPETQEGVVSMIESTSHCQAQVQLLDDTDSPGTTNIETTEVAAGNQEEDQQNQAGEDTQQSLAARTQAACQMVAES